jgi:hypothetical protein
MNDYFESEMKLRKVEVTRKDVLNNGKDEKLTIRLILAFCHHTYISHTLFVVTCHCSLYMIKH